MIGDHEGMDIRAHMTITNGPDAPDYERMVEFTRITINASARAAIDFILDNQQQGNMFHVLVREPRRDWKIVP